MSAMVEGYAGYDSEDDYPELASRDVSWDWALVQASTVRLAVNATALFPPRNSPHLMLRAADAGFFLEAGRLPGRL